MDRCRFSTLLRIGVFAAFATISGFGQNAIDVSAAPPATPAQAQLPQTPFRALVKLRGSLAKDVENALPLPALEMASGQSGNAHVEAFLSRHSGKKIKPVYPELVRAKKNRGLSEFQIASEIRKKFPKRAARFRDSFNPPELSRTYVMDVNAASSADLNRIIGELSTDSEVEYAEADKIVSVKDVTPNDPYFLSYGSWGQAYADLWGIRIIGSPAAWSINNGTGIVVAVVDTGVDLTHPDITNNLWTNPREIPGNGIDDDGNGYIDDVYGWDFIGHSYQNPTSDNNVTDGYGHGTHVSGTIAATGNNGIGVIGVAWGAKVMTVKGLDDHGYGLDSTLVSAIHYAADNGAEIISNSWAGQGSSQTIADAITYAYDLGAVVVVAAGNNNDDARNYYPANLPNVITVGASTPPSNGYEYRAYFSNWGSKIDVLAPGQDILSLRAAGTTMGTPVDAYYTRADGTSMATPHVSGTAALVLAQHPQYSNEDVRQVLRTSSTDIYFTGFDLDEGYGRLNASAALAVANVLEAKITGPADGTRINGPTSIVGTAQGNNFSYFTLEYGAGELPTSWTLFQSSTVPVNDKSTSTVPVLGTFDPSTLPDGIYSIRLTAYDTSGHAFVDRIELSVRYLTITSPAPPQVPVTASEFKPSTQISISGTAVGASFQDFRLDWAEGIEPMSGWSNTGLALTGGGTAPITNSVLGTWDTSAISKADYYTIRLSVDNSGFTSTAYTLVYLEPSLLSQNWPFSLDEGTYWSSGFVPSTDAAGNRRLTLASPGASTQSEFRTFSADGSIQTKNVLTYYGTLFQPAVGELDGVPGDEAAMSDALMLRSFHGDLTSYTLTPTQTVDFSYSQVLLEDLNNDSQLEVIALGEDYRSPTAYVYAYLRNGQQLNSNFPIAIANQNQNFHSYTFGSRVLAGDVDGDGNRELVVMEGTSPSTFTPLLFGNDGLPRTWATSSLNGTPDRMLLADLDHNGKLETIFTCRCNNRVELHVLQPDGTERAGWPFAVSSWSLSFLAVGDLNRDGNEEIVLSVGNQLFVRKTDGTSFSNSWPIQGSPFGEFGPIAIADINGDGLPEILTSEGALLYVPNPLLSTISSSSVEAQQQVTHSMQADDTAADATTLHPRVDVSAQIATSTAYLAPFIVAFSANGSVVQTWNMPGMNGNQPDNFAKVTVGDFNGDGLTDIAVTYWTIQGGGISGWLREGVATVLTTGAPFNASANDWPMIYQNARNTAVLIRDHTPPVVSVTSPAFGVSVVGPVTLTANAYDNVAVATLRFQVDGANVGPALTIAPFSYGWDSTQVPAGTHTITAIASDAAGNTAVSAPVSIAVQSYALLTFSPNPLSFGRQQIGVSSSAQTATLTNSDQTPATITAVSIGGDYSETDNCVTTLIPGASCTINIIFNPSVRGTDNGALTVTGSFSGAAPTLNLSGSGLSLQVTASPAALVFSGQPVGTSSTQQVTYTNSGDLTVTITGISSTGDFSQANTCGASLAPGANCTINVTFVPTAAGARNGVLSITGNVNTSVNLSGIGQLGQITVSPSTLNFGSQPPNTTSASQTITISSVGNYKATITGWSYPGEYGVSSNCPFFDLEPGTTCTFAVTFTPDAGGPRNGTLSINGAFQNSPANISLTGIGAVPGEIISPSFLSYSSQKVGSSSAPQTVTLTNNGWANLLITGFTVTGDFSQTNNCGTSLAPSATCTVSVVFSPTAQGTRSGTLTLSSNAPGTAPSVSLGGTGTIAPTATVSTTSLTFAMQRTGTTSSPQVVTLSNTGNSTLTISSITANGAIAFAQTNNCPTTLSAGNSCSINVTFAPIQSGTFYGNVTITDNSGGTSGSTQEVFLTGTGGASAAAISPGSLTFGSTNLGTSSAPSAVTITNSGTMALNFSSISASGDFSQSNNCGTSLSPGSSCAVNVVFSPTTIGSRSGTLAISGDFPGSPSSVSLNGTGVAPVAAFSPGSLSFSTQKVGTSSSAHNVTLTNTGTGTLLIYGFSVLGDYSQTNNCGGSLAPSGNCTVSIVFTPTARGTRSGTLTLSSNAGTAPSVSLSGTGVAAVVNFSTTSIAFGSQRVGTTSGSKSVHLTNSGDATLDFSGISISAGFTETNNCAATLAAGAHCDINLTFAPTTAGTISGALTVSGDQIGGPQAVGLSGTGIDYSLSASPSSADINAGASASYTVTVAAVSGDFNANVSLACAGLPAQASCSFSPSSINPNSTSGTSAMKITTKSGTTGTPSGTYAVTVNGTSGTAMHSTTVSLTVN